jgi:hypothetical protein
LIAPKALSSPLSQGMKGAPSIVANGRSASGFIKEIKARTTERGPMGGLSREGR